MRRQPPLQSSMLCLLSPEDRVPQSHPLRAVKKLADEALSQLSPVFDAMYSNVGRPSIPPEWLLKASLLMALYSVRSERLFCEQLDYNLLFRWFLDMDMVEPGFDHSGFSHNRERLLGHEVAAQFFEAVVDRARERNVTPHVAQRAPGPRRRSAIDGRTARAPGYAVSQRIRLRVEEILGWAKTVGNFRRTPMRGIERTQHAAYLVGAAYNLLRMARMLSSPP